MIIIIGAGLSGLLTAYRLKNQGVPFKILEARPRIGGRILTVPTAGDTPVEMGATWFGAQHQHLIALLKELEIGYFKQFTTGLASYQPHPNSAAERIQVPPQAPSYRISGGTSNLIHTLHQKLDESEVLLNQTVKQILFKENSVQVISEDIFEGNKVVLAIPPKLWAKRITFEPALPLNLQAIAEETHTWMEDSIKVAVSYSEPFWLENNRSGMLFSNSGPIVEFYDHCNQDRTKFALCGFVSPSYKSLSKSGRQSHIMHQLKLVFGKKAEECIDYTECLWEEEQHTYEATDIAPYPHQNNGNPIFRNSFFENKLMISSSESALHYPGYMDGAISSANEIAKKLINL